VNREQDAEPYELAATGRCIRRDLDLPEDAVAEMPAVQRERHPLLEAFYARRAQSPTGQETIEGLQANIVAYSLHAGRWRGLTWHDEELAIVWLLVALVECEGASGRVSPRSKLSSTGDNVPRATRRRD
jgi:hypothetical protein